MKKKYIFGKVYMPQDYGVYEYDDGRLYIKPYDSDNTFILALNPEQGKVFANQVLDWYKSKKPRSLTFADVKVGDWFRFLVPSTHRLREGPCCKTSASGYFSVDCAFYGIEDITVDKWKAEIELCEAKFSDAKQIDELQENSGN